MAGFAHMQIDKTILAVAAMAGHFAKTIVAAEQNKLAKPPTVIRRTTSMRPGRDHHAGYRGARRNAWHANRRTCAQLKSSRREMGLSRSQFDRLRRQVAQLNVRGDAHGYVRPKAPVIRLQPKPQPPVERALTELDKARLAKAEARRIARNAKRAAQSQTQRRAA